MLKLHAFLNRKPSSLLPPPCQVEAVVELDAVSFENLLQRPMDDQPQITAHKSLMRCEEGVEHCVLFLGEGSQDGVLVNSEGYDWARYPSVGALLPPISRAARASCANFSCRNFAFARFILLPPLFVLVRCQPLQCHGFGRKSIQRNHQKTGLIPGYDEQTSSSAAKFWRVTSSAPVFQCSPSPSGCRRNHPARGQFLLCSRHPFSPAAPLFRYHPTGRSVPHLCYPPGGE